MPADFWTVLFPAVAAAFLASVVEVVEAFTIVLAVALTRGWRPALAGTGAALALLALLAVVVALLGPSLQLVPIRLLQVAVGVLLLLFGMGWLRKAVLRAAGILALHDEEAAFAQETAALGGRRAGPARSNGSPGSPPSRRCCSKGSRSPSSSWR